MNILKVANGRYIQIYYTRFMSIYKQPAFGSETCLDICSAKAHMEAIVSHMLTTKAHDRV